MSTQKQTILIFFPWMEEKLDEFSKDGDLTEGYCFKSEEGNLAIRFTSSRFRSSDGEDDRLFTSMKISKKEDSDSFCGAFTQKADYFTANYDWSTSKKQRKAIQYCLRHLQSASNAFKEWFQEKTNASHQ